MTPNPIPSDADFGPPWREACSERLAIQTAIVAAQRSHHRGGLFRRDLFREFRRAAFDEMCWRPVPGIAGVEVMPSGHVQVEVVRNGKSYMRHVNPAAERIRGQRYDVAKLVALAWGSR